MTSSEVVLVKKKLDTQRSTLFYKIIEILEFEPNLTCSAGVYPERALWCITASFGWSSAIFVQKPSAVSEGFGVIVGSASKCWVIFVDHRKCSENVWSRKCLVLGRRSVRWGAFVLSP